MSYFRENIEKLEGYVPGFQPSEPNVIKLNTNENPYPPSPKVMDAIKGISEEKLRRYPEPLGDAFRKAASEILGVKPGNIICVNGGDDLLTICFRAFCDQDRPVGYPVQTYSLYPVLAELQSCKTNEIPFEDEDWADKLIQADAALTIICNPNAPTGSFVSIEKIAELAGNLSGVLFIDEAYVDFAKDNCIRLLKDFGNIIILRSMSKGYSLAGLRFGYGIACEEIINGLLKIKDSYNVDAVAIAAATAAIIDQDYFRENVEQIKTERKRLTQNLNELGLEVTESETNFLLARHENAGAIYEKLIKREIYVRYWNTKEMANKIRITVGNKVQNDKLISALKEIMP